MLSEAKTKAKALRYYDFFHVYALKIVGRKQTSQLNRLLRQLRGRHSFSYPHINQIKDPPPNDLKTIKLAIKCVALFERISFTALKAIQKRLYHAGIVRGSCHIESDETARKNPGRNPSFASKFIHFRAPEFVYIYDSVTKKRLRQWTASAPQPIDFKKMAKSLRLDVKDEHTVHYLKCYWLA